MQRKPVDVGNGSVCASFGLDAGWLSVGAPHPALGMLEVVGGIPFEVGRDGDPVAVREHRLRLCEPSASFLAVRDAEVEATSVAGVPTWQAQGDTWAAEVTAWAEPGRRTVTQLWRIRPETPGGVDLVFAGRLDRPGYAEITPIGPVPPQLGPSRLRVSDTRLEVTAPERRALATAAVTVATRNAVAAWSLTDTGANLSVTWDDTPSAIELRVEVTLDVAPESAPGDARQQSPRPLHRTAGDDVLARITDGALRYVLGCTALDVGPMQCCILTDHRLLPLSWTRDAYYQAALLLACADDAPLAVVVAERHLTWLWGPGRDAHGVWQRSHLTTGQVKDPAYQADQQLYPLLELADFRRTTGRWPGSRDDWGTSVRTVWSRLPRHANGLLPGEENPADDPSGLPYLLSSQLLLAYVARRLAEWEVELDLIDLGLAGDADSTMTAIADAFTCRGPAGQQWAYESDGGDGRRLYHDANDVPTALAPIWGLCGVDDPSWLGTMRFALSSHNPGFVGGRHGGLGSAHTPGVWSLGDAQEWAVAMTTGDQQSADRVLDRLRLVAGDDGMLPETYDPETGDWMARHWFAWPGALIGVLDRTLRTGGGPWLSDVHR